MAISDWPVQERPREKLLQQGAEKLSDAELLAIFLRTGTVGQSALDLARGLLTRFGGVRGVLEAGKDTFFAEPGMGESKYAQLQAALELTRRHMLETLQRSDCLTSSALTRNYIRSRTGAVNPQVAAYWREHFDLSVYLTRNWSTLQPSLDGKLHFFVGTADDHYLEDSVYKLRDTLTALGATAQFEFHEGKTHNNLFVLDKDPVGLLRIISKAMYAIARPDRATAR